MDFWAKRESNNTKVIPSIQNIETTLYHWKNENIGAHKIMVMGNASEIDALVTYINNELANDIVAYRSKDEYLEIAHRSISKKTAITTLLSSKYSEIRMENILAFGDNYNDISMLQAVGKGVAVANGIDEVLAVADYVTSANIENGVANYLESYL